MVRLLIGRSFDADSVDVSRISSHFNLLCYFVIAVGCLLTAGSYFSYTVLPCCINTLCVIVSIACVLRIQGLANSWVRFIISQRYLLYFLPFTFPAHQCI
eukprot:Sdes_comp20034_c0_seq1m12823